MNHYFICQHCGETFKNSKAAYRKPKFCSMVCFRAFQKNQRVTKSCLKCGKEFTQAPAMARDRKFCSQTCSNRYHKVADPAKHSTFTCEWCSKEFESWTYRQPRFCSRLCAAHYGGKASGGAPRKPEIHIILVCKTCSEPYTTTTHQVRLRGSGYCSRRCYWDSRSISALGENNPNWKGGVSAGDYGPHWIATARKIRKRDNHTCQTCGYRSGGNMSLDVHHIIPVVEFNGDWQTANQHSNLVSLCRSCHLKVRSGKIQCPMPMATLATAPCLEVHPL